MGFFGGVFGHGEICALIVCDILGVDSVEFCRECDGFY